MRLKGIHKVKVKGKTYLYQRATRTKLTCAADDVLGLAAEIRAIEDEAKGSAPEDRHAPKSWGWLRTAYLASPEFEALAPKTRQQYRNALKLIDGLNARPLADITPPRLFAIRDKLAKDRGWRTANVVLAVISLIWAWGRPRKGLGPNPAQGVPKIARPKGQAQMHRPWAEDELAAVLKAASPQLRMPIALMAYTGLRSGDAITILHAALSNGWIEWRQNKTGEPVWLPLHSALPPLIEAELARPARRQEGKPEALTLCTNGKGQPWTKDGLSTSWQKLRTKLERSGSIKPGLTLHGLRHTVGTRLADAGADTRTIMAVTGHKTEAQVATYVRNASQRTRAQAGITLLEEARSGEE